MKASENTYSSKNSVDFPPKDLYCLDIVHLKRMGPAGSWGGTMLGGSLTSAGGTITYSDISA